ncbi:ABC transporter permease [Mycetocola tolaasinivorans]|uniref:ABC transporter permease n=1 Tax=Mycetocola tolaasinivorans TaxID=76635 RepID=A0A3L7A7L4_9MICO|nr:ABC transporter permease [Mycetocola tolaasinivorans]RLP76075.1 ABC transporter permease [Mycetocola tolaasinivorans]
MSTLTKTKRPRGNIGTFLARRIFQSVIVILIVTLIVFSLLHLALPQGPALGVLGMQATQEQIDAFNHKNGFDLPLWQQYLNFLWQLLHGDLGASFTLNKPVSVAIGQRLPKTMALALIGMIVALIVAIPMGIYQATRRGKAGDVALTAWNFVIYSTPSFFLGLILVIVFSQWLRWFPAQAPQGSTVGEVLSNPAGLVLPVLTMALGIIATFSRYMRSATIDNLSEDYVRTARAKGTSVTVVVTRHVVRNSLTPVIAMLGYYLPVMFGGMIVVESLFNYPGMGLLFWSAAQTSDYPVLLGCVLIIAIATVVGSLLADLIQALLDPRTRGELA